MKYLLTFLISTLATLSSLGQVTFTPIHFPSYMAVDGDVPYACRFAISGLNPNATYRYINQFVDNPNTSSGTGAGIYVRANGDFERVSNQGLFSDAYSGQFTTDGAGAYTGWFMIEANTSSIFTPGYSLYFRIALNNGNGGASSATRLTSPTPVSFISFDNTVSGGTGVRSTPATDGAAKNFVMLYDNEAGTGNPISGTYIEVENAANFNTAANGYASFYTDNVDGVAKTWGAIIPNNLPNGIRRIVQYSLADGTEVGYKTSADGSWAIEGGGTASTVNAAGGATDVIVLDGSIVTLGIPVAQQQAITFNPFSAKTYGDADFDAGATASSNLPVTYTSSNPAVAVIVNGKVHIAGAGTTEITAEQAGNTDFLAAAPVMQVLTVSKAPLIVTAENKTILQGDPIPVFTIAYNGFLNNENETSLTTPATASTTAGNSTTPGTYDIIPGGAVSPNYDFSYVNGTLTITATQQPQTITFNPLPEKVYGDGDFNTGASISSNLPLNYASSEPAVATIDNSGLVHIVGAGTTTITVSQDGNSAYQPAIPVSQPLTVSPAGLTVIADNKTKLEGQGNPPLTVTYNGFVNGETNLVLTAQPGIATTATASSPAGDYPITVSGASAANYTISHIDGTLTVQPLPSQMITFDAPPVKRYGDEDFAAGATASSGLAVTYASSNPQVVTINSGLIHITGAGTAEITASQPGDASNAPATPVTRVLTVQKANLEVRAIDTVKNEGQANPVLTVAYSGFVNGDNAASLATQPVITTTATANSLTGNYTISVSGAASPNYNIAHVNGVIRVLPPNGKDQDMVNAYLSAPGKLKVNYYATVPEKVSVQLFDSYGNCIIDAKLSANAGLNTWYFEVGNTATGVYPVRIIGKETAVRTKVFIR